MNSSALELNKECPPADKPADIQRMAALIQAIHHPQKDGRVLRAQHAKDICLVGERVEVCHFTVARFLDRWSRLARTSELVG
jgi:hypothetical protein